MKIIIQYVLTYVIIGRFINSNEVLAHNMITNSLARKVPFMWGTATAAYQIEGAAHSDGRGDSIWDKFSHIPGKIHNNDNGDIADDSYNQYKEDIKLMKDMGMSAYRFSISWSRILPLGNGEINYVGVNHYNKLIDELLRNNIEPLVTLYHWDLPDNLEQTYKGWLSKNIVKDFARYAEICYQAFGDRVKYWITINEPWTFVYLGYGQGIFAPGRCSNRNKCFEGDSATEPYIAAHNVLLSHAAAVQIYRQKYQSLQKGQIGITLNHDWNEPLTNLAEDIIAAERRNQFLMGWFADPIVFGKYPTIMEEIVGDRLPKFTPAESESLRGSFDFWALNHYTSMYVSNPTDSVTATFTEAGWSQDMHVVESKFNKEGVIIGPRADSPWLTVVPYGFYKTIKWSHNRYSSQFKTFPIIITENGCNVPNESTLTLQQALQDDFRINYYTLYLAQMEKAIAEGVDIRGYMAWSLLDNFEWADGYNYRFGLHYVDYTTPERTRYPKASSHWYAAYAKSHGVYVISDDHTITGVQKDDLSHDVNDNENEKNNKKNTDGNNYPEVKNGNHVNNNHDNGQQKKSIEKNGDHNIINIEDFYSQASLSNQRPTSTGDNDDYDDDSDDTNSKIGYISTKTLFTTLNENNEKTKSSNNRNDNDNKLNNLKSSNNIFYNWLSSIWMQGWQLAQIPEFRQQLYI